jgi:hypothetical protein
MTTMETVKNTLGAHAKETKNEDKITGTLERVTAKVPSISFLAVASTAALVSGGLYLLGRKEAAIFIGNWVPSFLLLGVYNKLVKQHEDLSMGQGSDNVGSQGSTERVS